MSFVRNMDRMKIHSDSQETQHGFPTRGARALQTVYGNSPAASSNANESAMDEEPEYADDDDDDDEDNTQGYDTELDDPNAFDYINESDNEAERQLLGKRALQQHVTALQEDDNYDILDDDNDSFDEMDDEDNAMDMMEEDLDPEELMRVHHWSQGQLDLHSRLGELGKFAAFPATWALDFISLPDELFVEPEEQALICSMHPHKQAKAILAFDALMQLGGRIRDKFTAGIKPEAFVKKALKRYVDWGMMDGQIRRLSILHSYN